MSDPLDSVRPMVVREAVPVGGDQPSHNQTALPRHHTNDHRHGDNKEESPVSRAGSQASASGATIGSPSMAEITRSADDEGFNQLMMRCAHPKCRQEVAVHPEMDREARAIYLGSGWYVNWAGLWYCPEHTMHAHYEDARKDHEPFAGGGVREAQGDRARFELLVPLEVPFSEQLLTRCAVHMAKGAEKYTARNWESFSDEEALDRARSSALRHLFQWVTDTDDGEDHAAAVVFNLMAAEHIKWKLGHS